MTLRFLIRSALGLCLCAAVSAPAFAQGYPTGGTGTGTGTGTYSAPKGGYSSGTGAAIGGGVAAGAVVAYLALRKASITGCVEQASDGFKVMDKKGNTYMVDANGETLKAGDQVKLIGKKITDKTGSRTFRLTKSPEDLGPCSQTAQAQTTQ